MQIIHIQIKWFTDGWQIKGKTWINEMRNVTNGDAVMLLGHFAHQVWVHSSPQRERSLQINTKLFMSDHLCTVVKHFYPDEWKWYEPYSFIHDISIEWNTYGRFSVDVLATTFIKMPDEGNFSDTCWFFLYLLTHLYMSSSSLISLVAFFKTTFLISGIKKQTVTASVLTPQTHCINSCWVHPLP